MTRAVALFLGLGLSGCLAPPGNVEPLSVELGTGEWQFEPLVDEQEVWLVNGSQGGWHIWTSVRADLSDGRRVALEVSTCLADGPEVWQHSNVEVDFQPETSGQAFIGWPAVIAQPWTVADQRLRLRVTVTDRTGRVGSDERVLLVRYVPTL